MRVPPLVASVHKLELVGEFRNVEVSRTKLLAVITELPAMLKVAIGIE